MENNEIRDLKPYLTFRLGDENYALEISKVREVLKYSKMTRIPKTPDYMCGVINLRGGVVSVVDLKLKFGMDKVADLVNSNIIILEMALGSSTVLIGALVDSVQEVLELDKAGIESAPKLGMNLSNDFILGIGKKGDDFLIILDIDRIFSTSDITLLSGVQGLAKEEA